MRLHEQIGEATKMIRSERSRRCRNGGHIEVQRVAALLRDPEIDVRTRIDG